MVPLLPHFVGNPGSGIKLGPSVFSLPFAALALLSASPPPALSVHSWPWPSTSPFCLTGYTQISEVVCVCTGSATGQYFRN